MPSSSRLPAIAGAAQCVQRVDDPRDAAPPLAMMEQALRAAAEDAGAPKLLEALDAILVPQGIWKYGDPGRLLAERVGAPGATSGVGAISGHIVQVMVDWACSEIAAGRRDVVAIVGGESEHSRRRLLKLDLPVWDEAIPGEPDQRFGNERLRAPKPELSAGVLKPSMCFALCETALRHARGEAPAAHRRRIAALAARLSEVAANNPHAWIQRPVSAEEIATVSPANRMVSYPYTKLMTANIAVDQSAALILCSAEAARRFGVADEGLVYLRAATEMHHVQDLSEREHLHRHPGLELAARRALELAGIETGALAHVDLYSCFPFAVQAAAAALGLDEARPLSVTGGLTFAGGPFGNYVVQATARMVECLRGDPGSLGLVGSVGGVFAKFAFGLYSSDPGEAAAPRIEDVSAPIAALPCRAAPGEYRGTARVESYTCDVLPSGPLHAAFSALTERGERVWARSEDPALMQALLADEEFCGREAQLSGGGIELL